MIKSFLKTHKLLIATFFIIAILLYVGLYVDTTSIDLKEGTVNYYNNSDKRVVEYDSNETVIHNATPIITSTVIGTLKGPKKAKKGQNVKIEYRVTNKGNKTIYGVEIEGQCIDEYIGTIKPGQTRKIVYSYSTEGFSNPMGIGGEALYFKYGNGSEYVTNFDAIEIKLI